MIRLKKRKNLSVGIMISPMIDMSFLLLVFFIVSTMNMNEVKTLPVKLPQASQVEVDTKSLYHVTVLPDGRLFLEDKTLTKEAFLLSPVWSTIRLSANARANAPPFLYGRACIV